MLLDLPEDVLVSVLSAWTDATDLCRTSHCSTDIATSLEKIYNHAGFVLKPNRYLKDACVSWLSSKKIKVELKREHIHIETLGLQYWQLNGKLHRDNDLPAVIDTNGDQWWYQNGKRHRDNDLPAVISAVGTQCWYRHGKLYRDNGLPAYITSDGIPRWYQQYVRWFETFP